MAQTFPGGGGDCRRDRIARGALLPPDIPSIPYKGLLTARASGAGMRTLLMGPA